MKKDSIISLFILLLMLAIAFSAGRHSAKRLNAGAGGDTTYITEFIHDTTTIEKPVPYASRELKDSIRALVALNIAKEHMIDSLLGETSMAPMDTIVEISLPREQKEYRDSSYHAWVSGYQPALDSISIFNRTEIHTITIRETAKPKRWGVGIQAGMGFSVHENKAYTTPYIGVGVTYNILAF